MIESKQKQRVLFVSPLTSSVVGGIAKWSANIWNYYNKEIVRTSVELVPCYNENINNQLIDGGIWWRIKNILHLHRTEKRWKDKNNINNKTNKQRK